MGVEISSLVQKGIGPLYINYNIKIKYSPNKTENTNLIPMKSEKETNIVIKKWVRMRN